MSAQAHRALIRRPRRLAATRTPVGVPAVATQASPEMLGEATLERVAGDPSQVSAALAIAAPALRAHLVGHLQRSLGNAAVQRMVAAHAHVQRCGSTPCGCSPQERAVNEAQMEAPAATESSAAERETDLGAQIESTRDTGQPLDQEAQRKLAPVMRMDLSRVSIHTDGQADHLARSVAADAFTSGNDIYFRAGHYQPHSTAGLHLLAHELTHTAQQSRGEVSGVQHASGVTISDPADTFEQAAERNATATVAAVTAGGHVQRRPTPTRTRRRVVQRATRGSAGGPVIQRKNTDTSADFKATFDPSVRNTADNSSRNFSSDLFHQDLPVTPGTKGSIIFPVLVNWERAAGGGGPGPNPGPSTLCDQIQDPTAKKLCNCDLLPDQKLKDICKAGGDPSSFIDSLSVAGLIALIALIPGGQPFAVALAAGCSAAELGRLIANLFGANLPSPCTAAVNAAKNFLKNLLGGKPSPGPGPAPAAKDVGNGRAVLETRFQFDKDGKLVLLGPGPRIESNGPGAEVASPVGFSRDPLPDGGANISIQPMVRTIGGGVNHVFQHTYDVDLTMPAPPVPVDVCCGHEVFPFVIGSDKLIDEDTGIETLFAWFRGLEPPVRKAVETGKLPIIVKGRASATGNRAFNLELSEKRAKRVQTMVKDFAGSDAKVIIFGQGNLVLPRKGPESGHERRVTVKAKGQVAGTEALKNAGCGPINDLENKSEECAEASPEPVTVTAGGTANIEDQGSKVPVTSNGKAADADEDVFRTVAVDARTRGKNPEDD